MKNRFLIAAVLALSLAGCAHFDAGTAAPIAASVADSVGVPPPATVANKTVLDEQLGRGVELGYKGFRLAMNTAIDAGQMTAARAAVIKPIDAKLFALTQAVQHAYAAGNSASYSAAVKQANAAIADGLAALGKK
jgi:hypothetical protein